MSAWEQIGKKVQKTAKPSVANLAKQNILSLSKETVLFVVNQTIPELSVLKTIPKEPKTCNALGFCNNSKNKFDDKTCVFLTQSQN